MLKVFLLSYLKKKDFYDILKSTELDLSKSKYLLIRQNPPFNMNYVMSTLYLEKLIDKMRVINNPTAVRNISEKFILQNFLDLCLLQFSLKILKLF